MDLFVVEMHQTIDGEVNSKGQGVPTYLIRLAGCNLKCFYCDTKYSWEIKNQNKLGVEYIVDKVLSSNIKKATITGGEPFLQVDGVSALIKKLVVKGLAVSVETNGTIFIPDEYFMFNPDFTCYIVDYKFVDDAKIIYANYSRLRKGDWVKFIIQNKADYIKAVERSNYLVKSLNCCAKIAFSCMYGGISYESLLRWIMCDINRVSLFSNVYLNVQLHKFIFKDERELNR